METLGFRSTNPLLAPRRTAAGPLTASFRTSVAVKCGISLPSLGQFTLSSINLPLPLEMICFTPYSILFMELLIH